MAVILKKLKEGWCGGQRENETAVLRGESGRKLSPEPIMQYKQSKFKEGSHGTMRRDFWTGNKAELNGTI
jgi:hypothetical protein